MSIQLEVKNVTKRFGGITALADVSLQVSENEILSIIGPNGAGKTTLFNLITGLYHPDEGTIKYHGRDITNFKPHNICRIGIVKTFQNIRLFNSLTVFENVWISQNWYTSSGLKSIFSFKSAEEKKLRKRVKEILEFIGLYEKWNMLASNLPYGDHRCVEIAAALATEAKIILLDEPAAGMNPVESEELTGKIAKIRNEMEKTIIIIEHDMKVVMDLSDKIIVINFGQKIAEGKPEEIQRNSEVVEAYLGSEEEQDA